MRDITLDANPRLRAIITITRKDATVIRVSNAMRAITNDGETWLPFPGLKLADFSERNDGTVPGTSLSVSMERSGLFDPLDVDTGQFEDALVDIDLINANASSPDQRFFLFTGKILGDTSYGIDRQVSFDIVGKFSIPRDDFVRKYTLPCDADFGDARRCKIPTFPDVEAGSSDLHDLARLETVAVSDRRRFRFAAGGTPDDYANVYLEATSITTGITAAGTPTPSATVSTTYVDGGVTWTTRNAWLRYAQVGTIYDSRNFLLDNYTEARATDNTYLTPGRLKVATGYCTGKVAQVRTWDSTSLQVEIIQPFALLMQTGDWIEIAPDCDKTLDMCVDKYANAYNYRGFPHLTGSKVVTSIIIPGVTVFPGPTDDPGAPDDGPVDGYAAFAVEFAAGDS